MKLLLALMIWSQGCFASAAAGASAAADVKAAGEKERKGTVGVQRSKAVREGTGMIPELSAIVAEYAHEYPEIPQPIAKALRLWGISGSSEGSAPQMVMEWVAQDPNNINGVLTGGDGNQESLLMMAITAYLDNPHAGGLLRKILALKPDVRYKAKGDLVSQDALHAMFDIVPPARTDYMDFVQNIIDLLLAQGTTRERVADELQAILAEHTLSEAAQKKLRGHTRRAYDHTHKMIKEALEYLRHIPADPSSDSKN